MTEGDGLSEIVRRMRARARIAQFSSYIFVLLVVVIGGAAVYLFFEFSTDRYTVRAETGANVVIGGGEFAWLKEITLVVVRIGGVLLAVFIINILVSFARYNAKVANALQTRADTLMIVGKDFSQLASVFPIMMTDAIEFGQTPQNPYDTYFEMIKGLVSAGRLEKGKP